METNFLEKYEKLNKISNTHHVFKQFEDHFDKTLQDKMNLFDIDLVIYDETEFFKDWNDPLFNYPFTNRKSLIQRFKFNLTNHDYRDYLMDQSYISFQKSLVCLEDHYLSELNIQSLMGETFDAFKQIF